MNSVIIKLTNGILNPKEYRFRIPKAGRDLFPNCYAEVELQTNDIGVMKRHYNPDYHELSIGKWFSAHPELKAGDKLCIKVIEQMRKYHLEIVK